MARFDPNMKTVTQVVSEIKKQVLTLVVLAFGFAAALLWRDAIMAGLKDIGAISAQDPGTKALFISALFVTGIAVLVIVFMTRLFGEKTELKLR